MFEGASKSKLCAGHLCLIAIEAAHREPHQSTSRRSGKYHRRRALIDTARRHGNLRGATSNAAAHLCESTGIASLRAASSWRRHSGVAANVIGMARQHPRQGIRRRSSALLSKRIAQKENIIKCLKTRAK